MSDLREALEKAYGDDDSEVEVEAAPVETPEVEAEAAPETPPETPTDDAVPPAGEEKAPKPVEEPAKVEPQARPEHRVDRAPQSWRKEAKGEWNALPLHVRQEVYRREQEVNKVLRETGETRQSVEEFQKTVSPYMARIQQFGLTPTQAAGELFKTDHLLATSNPTKKAEVIASLMDSYGVDVKELDSVLSAKMSGKTPPKSSVDPDYINNLVQQQLQQALAPIYQERQAAQQNVQQQALSAVEEMSLNPEYPYFDQLRDEMADIMEVAAKRGIDLSLQDAYAKAVLLDPEVSQQQGQQAASAQANQQHLQAQRAKAAASSVTGAPAGGGSQTYQGDGSVRGAIEAAFNNARI